MITREQIEERRQGLGGSDIAGIIPSDEYPTKTLSPFATQVQIWASKVNPAEDDRKETEAMWWGSEEEELIDRRFNILTGMRTVRYNNTIHDGCLIANVDRLIIPAGQKVAAHQREIRTDAFAEYKNAGCAWADSEVILTLPNGYPVFDAKVSVVPYYITQGFHYMGRIPTAEICFYGVKHEIPCGRFTRKEFKVYALRRDDAAIAQQDAYARWWWQEHIIGGKRPEAVCEKDCKILWLRSAPATSVTITNPLAKAWRDYHDASERIEAAEADKAAAKVAMQRAMGETEAIVAVDGKTVLATWKSAKDKTIRVTDWEKLARAKGVTDAEIVEATSVTTKPGARTFLLKDTEAAKKCVDGLLADTALESAGLGALTDASN